MPELPSPAPSDPSADTSAGNGNGNGTDAAFADILRIEAAAPGDDRPFEERFKEALGEGVATAEPAVEPIAQAAAEPVDDGAMFLAEMTKAMQASAAAERARANAEIDRRRLEHLTGIEARRKTQADEMSALADQDLRAIEAWAEGERRRIDRERDTRAAAVRDDLRASLAEHGSKIDREVEAVEAAISAHRANVDAFFTELDSETEPVAIALHARRRPTFPSLTDLPIDAEPAPAVAEAVATAEPIATQAGEAPEAVAETAAIAADVEVAPAEQESGVAVMATDASPAPTGAWHPWASITEAADAEASEIAAAGPSESAPPADGPEHLEVVAVTSSASKPVESSVLQSVKVSRPLSWLRRGDHQDQD